MSSMMPSLRGKWLHQVGDCWLSHSPKRLAAASELLGSGGVVGLAWGGGSGDVRALPFGLFFRLKMGRLGVLPGVFMSILQLYGMDRKRLWLGGSPWMQ